MIDPAFVVKANLVLAILLLVYMVFLRQETFLKLNRAYLLLTIPLALLLPLSSIPGLDILPQIPAIPVPEALIGPEGIFEPGAISSLLMLVYAAGVLFFGLRFVFQFYRLLQMRGRFTAEVFDDYTLVHARGAGQTFSFFRWLFWDDAVQLSESQRRAVFRHELVHIRQWHSLDSIVFELCLIVLWFNPLMHVLKRHLREIHEFLADREAVSLQGRPAYERLLVRHCFALNNLVLPQRFGPGNTRARIAMLRRSRSGAAAVGKYALAAPLLCGLACLFSLRTPLVQGGHEAQMAYHADLPQRSKSLEPFVMPDYTILAQGNLPGWNVPGRRTEREDRPASAAQTLPATDNTSASGQSGVHPSGEGPMANGARIIVKPCRMWCIPDTILVMAGWHTAHSVAGVVHNRRTPTRNAPSISEALEAQRFHFWHVF